MQLDHPAHPLRAVVAIFGMSYLLLSAAMVPGAALIGWIASRPGARWAALLGPAFLIAVQSSVERGELGTATSTLQFSGYCAAMTPTTSQRFCLVSETSRLCTQADPR